MCAAETEDEILAGVGGRWGDRDRGRRRRDAFREMAEPYLRENFTPEQVEVLDAIRSLAE